jgi:pyruvate/2-oxoglutarate dehydrogenase complex dihydrolipoamide acyltransferase (E2) component
MFARIRRMDLALALCLVPGLLVAGCKQKNAEVASSAPAAAPAPSTSAPTPSPAPGAPAAAAPAAGAAAPAAAAGQAVADTTAKLAAAQWAMRQDEIKTDPDGQWAVEAKASSSYNDAQGEAAWSAKQATGAPDVDKYGDDGHAWAPKTPDAGIEWLDLKYAKPVHAAEVRVRESCGSGAVIKVELFDEGGAAHTIWQGDDPTKDLNYLTLQFKPTDYKVNRVKVTLATNVIPGWNEVDAVQLVGKP